MTTIKELKDWLSRFPEDAIIEVGIQQIGGDFETFGEVKFISPKLEDNDYGDGWEFMDFRENKFVKNDAPYFAKCFLRLGGSC